MADRRALPTVLLIAVAAVVGVLIVLVGIAYYQRDTTTAIVLDKERVCSANSDNGVTCQYLVFTDQGTFRLADALTLGRFNSSDLYGQIRVCHRYELEHYGWRNGFTSTYPNIADLTDLGRVESCEP